MKITFKNVGQGDTIILEWLDNEIPKIGIIDCRKVGKENPVIEHLKIFDWGDERIIDFIILSHPHFDHFSGMSDLLDYCEANNIVVKRFGHSFRTQNKYLSYLNWANFDNEKTGHLKKLVDKLKAMNRGTIRRTVSLVEDWNIRLNSEYRLLCIRPSDGEDERYREKMKNNPNNPKAESSAANLFSTVLMLQSEKCYTLFTSDATFETIDDILRRDMEERFVNQKLALAQIPHHGSQHNHQIVFWENLRYNINTPAVISAGEHKQYNHPDIEVIRGFDDNNYKVYATNDVNGMADFLKENPQYLSDKLNMHNKLIEERYDKSRDLSFELKYGAALYIS